MAGGIQNLNLKTKMNIEIGLKATVLFNLNFKWTNSNERALETSDFLGIVLEFVIS